MYCGAVLLAIIISFILGVIFAFTMPVWLVIILQMVLALGVSCCIFKKK